MCMLSRRDLFVANISYLMRLVTGFGSVFPLYRQQGTPDASFNYLLLSVVITAVLWESICAFVNL